MLPILVFLLMMLDYCLTVLAHKLKNKRYAEYFKLNYELNPFFKKTIEINNLVNLKHVMFSIMFSLLIYCISYLISDNVLELLSGAIIIHNLLIIGKHISNIRVFLTVIKKKGLIEGKVSLSDEYLLVTSQSNYLIYIVILITISIFSFSFFVFGGLINCIIMFFMHYYWAYKAKKDNIKLRQ